MALTTAMNHPDYAILFLESVCQYSESIFVDAQTKKTFLVAHLGVDRFMREHDVESLPEDSSVLGLEEKIQSIVREDHIQIIYVHTGTAWQRYGEWILSIIGGIKEDQPDVKVWIQGAERVMVDGKAYYALRVGRSFMDSHEIFVEEGAIDHEEAVGDIIRRVKQILGYRSQDI